MRISACKGWQRGKTRERGVTGGQDRCCFGETDEVKTELTELTELMVEVCIGELL